MMKTSSNIIKSVQVLSLLCCIMLGMVFCCGVMLNFGIVYADGSSATSSASVTVPAACTLSGTGMDSHNAEINNGQYNSNIGTTTLKAFCNDNEGFSIYAVGFTDNEIGKNVLTNSTLGSTHDIVTGTEISGNTSDWAMKLATVSDPTPTYPIIIMGSTDDTEKQAGDPDYSAFQNVPSREDIIVHNGETPLHAIARHYLETSQCPRFMDQHIMRERKQFLADVVKEYKADGLIISQMKFCEYWSYERTIDTLIFPKDFGIPVCSIEKEYVNNAVGQLRTRFQAFVESIELKSIQKANKDVKEEITA